MGCGEQTRSPKAGQGHPITKGSIAIRISIFKGLDQFIVFFRTLFVVDQAYARYSVMPVLTDSEVLERKNVILLNSLTKQFVVPGLRNWLCCRRRDIIETPESQNALVSKLHRH